MEKQILEIIENRSLNKAVYKMVLKGDFKNIKNPDEFINISLKNFYLRRPFSVADYTLDTLTIIYKVLGEGTKEMTNLKIGDKLDVLIGLGNGFYDMNSQKPLLIAGGIGIAPFINLIKEFNKKGIRPTLIYGEQTKNNFILLDFFKDNTKLYLTTDDGSLGYFGNSVDFIRNNIIDYDKFYACGPMPMLKNLNNVCTKIGYVSLEARMGCGFGACMGCSIKTVDGYKRVCKEGPVFLASEVIYE